MDILSKIVYGYMKDFLHHWEFIVDVFPFPCTKVVCRISEYKQTQDEFIFYNMFNDLSSSRLAPSTSYIALQEDHFVKFWARGRRLRFFVTWFIPTCCQQVIKGYTKFQQYAYILASRTSPLF